MARCCQIPTSNLRSMDAASGHAGAVPASLTQRSASQKYRSMASPAAGAAVSSVVGMKSSGVASIEWMLRGSGQLRARGECRSSDQKDGGEHENVPVNVSECQRTALFFMDKCELERGLQ